MPFPLRSSWKSGAKSQNVLFPAMKTVVLSLTMINPLSRPRLSPGWILDKPSSLTDCKLREFELSVNTLELSLMHEGFRAVQVFRVLFEGSGGGGVLRF